MSWQNSTTVFLCIWLFSNVAFSRGSIAPELPLLNTAKTSVEYPLLRRIQELTLDLQMLEITIKNRRDEKTEEKISTSLSEIENEAHTLSEKFRGTRLEQIDGLFSLFTLGRHYGKALGVAPIEWDELFNALKEGQITSGLVVVHTPNGTLNLLTLNPLYMGKQNIWRVQLPTFDRKSFWVQARAKSAALGVRAPILSNAALEGRFEIINALYGHHETMAKEYFTRSYSKLYGAFEEHRYAVLQRISLTRKALTQLAQTNGAMGSAENYAMLYNRVLEDLFSYGVDIRDFAIKGFLFSDSPERSQELLQKLKFHPGESPAAYNSPSS